MQSRRDHLQAYQFSVGRLVRAVAAGDSTAADTPFRRANLGVIAGTVLAALLGGGCVLYGLISPAASSAWRTPGTIIVEKETGTRFLLVNGQLRPTANYASALLAVGQKASVQYVSSSTLSGLPVGAPIGIAGAPDELPATLSAGVWSLCLRPDGETVLDVAPVGPVGTSLGAQRALVSSTDEANPAEYLVIGSVKYPLPTPAVLTALGLGDQQPIPAAPAWLDALPTGPAVAAAKIPGAGTPGPPIGGHPAQVGALFSTDADGVLQYYVLLPDGLSPITLTEAALFAVAGAPQPVQESPSAIATAPLSANRSLLTRLPNLLSGSVVSSGTLCVTQHSPGSAADSQVVVATATPSASAPSVVVPPHQGMLVQPPGGNATTPAPEYLITDTGEKYLVSDSDALDALGYSNATADVMPKNIIDLIPSGPELDVSAARESAAWPSG
jgi:type VII secretion protein EccB